MMRPNDLKTLTTPKNSFHLNLCIAEIPVQISTNSQSIYERCQTQFQKFLSIQEDFLLNIQVNARPGIYFPNPDGTDNFFNNQVFEKNHCHVHSNFFQGSIDIENNEAQVLIDDENPESWIEHFLRIAFGVIAFKHNTVLFHGAGLIHDGQGFIFFGPSGSGKTTVTGFSPQCRILGDDLIIIKKTAGGYRIFSSPFNSEKNIGDKLINENAPLTGLFRLIQDKERFLKKMASGLAIADLIASIPPVNKNSYASESAMNFCFDLIEEIPCYELHFTKDNKFWRLIDGHVKKISETRQANCLACG